MRLNQADPSNLEALRAALRAEDPGGRLHDIEMREIRIGSDVLEQLPRIVESLAPGGKVALVADGTRITRGGQDLKAMVAGMLRRHPLEVITLHQDPLHADEVAAERIMAGIGDADCVVAVGSGTICDLCKDATYRTNPATPLVVVQTALSVNAFSDGVAVVLRNGVKRTVPARYPTALLIDLDVIVEAPGDMNLAGFGDLTATWTAPVDWRLAGLLGMSDTYHQAPGMMMGEQNRQLFDNAARLADVDAAALLPLARVLTLSGLAMGIAGESSPSSGTEHIVSHLIDMSARNRPLAYHGQQVSVSAILTAIAWEILLEELDPAAIDPAACVPPQSVMEGMVRAAFASQGDVAAGECWSDYKKKLALWSQKGEELKGFLGDWPAIRDDLRAATVPAAYIVDGLRAAGAPTRYSQMNVPVDAASARWALRNCHLMRNRFTLADLLFYIGWWNEDFVERLLRRAGELDAGL